MDTAKQLGKYQNMLEQYAFPCAIARQGGEIPFDQLEVVLGEDDQGREQLMTLRLMAQRMELEEPDSPRPQRSEYFLQFFVRLPFSVEDRAIGEVSRTILFFNKSLDLPGFGFSEVDRMVYYRYPLYTADGEVNDELMMGIVGMIMLCLDTFAPMIEQVAKGEVTLNQVVEGLLSTEE